MRVPAMADIHERWYIIISSPRPPSRILDRPSQTVLYNMSVVTLSTKSHNLNLKVIEYVRREL